MCDRHVEPTGGGARIHALRSLGVYRSRRSGPGSAADHPLSFRFGPPTRGSFAANGVAPEAGARSSQPLEIACLPPLARGLLNTARKGIACKRHVVPVR